MQSKCSRSLVYQGVGKGVGVFKGVAYQRIGNLAFLIKYKLI